MPTAASTEPDDLLPARIESRAAGTDDALRGTRLDGARYESFVRKLAEEVVLQVGDPRVDPPARTRKM